MANGTEGERQREAQGRDEGFIRISNRELYDMMSQVRDRVQGLENRVDNVLGENQDLRKRVRALELKSYGIMAGLLGAVVVLLKVGGIGV